MLQLCYTTTTTTKTANKKHCTLISTKDDVTTKYINDTVNEHTQVLEANNTSYIYGNSRVASINQNKSLFIDSLNGSVNKTISKGNIETINYSSNGQTSTPSGFLYNGEAKDATGLIYLRARYYNPKIGIFIQIDSHQGTKENLLSQNRYTYAENNPYKNIDPSGHFSIKKFDLVKSLVKNIKDKTKNSKLVNATVNVIQSLLPKVKEKSSNSANDAKNVANKFINSVVNIVKPAIPKKTNADTNSKGKSSKEDKLKTQYENALKSRKGNATQWTSDGKKCFVLTDNNNRQLDTSSIWFIENGITYRIVKKQCINYKGTSKSSSDIGVSLGDPTYEKVEGNSIVFEILRKLLSPVADFIFKTIYYMFEFRLSNLVTLWELGCLIVQGRFAEVLDMAGQSAVYMVGYMLVAGIAVILMGFFPGIIGEIIICFATATFLLLVELAFIDFDMNVYQKKHNLTDAELWPHIVAKFLDFAILIKCFKKWVDRKVKGKGDDITKDVNKDIPDKVASEAGYEILEKETINRTVGKKIKGYTKHGLNQAIGRDGGKGVSPEAILDTVRNPKNVVTQTSQYGPTFKYVSDKAVVVLNEEGKVVTTYAKGSQWTRGGK